MRMNNKVTAIIQARMGSTRLPGKVLKDVAGRPMIEQMMHRLSRAKRLNRIVAATSTTVGDDPLAELLYKNGILTFRGPENDVLSRYYEAAKVFNADVVVRLTGDCPLIDPFIVDEVVKRHLDSDADYTSNTLERTFPLGMDTEVFSFKVLEKAYRQAKENYQREHVTPYFYLNPGIFKLQGIKAEGKLHRPDLRLTVDTAEDLELIRAIYNRLGQNGRFFNTEEVIELLDTLPELVAINVHVQQKGLIES
jgi:spore coat polysaccharide biosynthesis protein SpsF